MAPYGGNVGHSGVTDMDSDPFSFGVESALSADFDDVDDGGSVGAGLVTSKGRTMPVKKG